MKHTAHALVIGSLTALFALPTLADHNSVKGAGWANMPNDIHNTRIEDDLSSTEFSNFVRMGGGADSVNRYLDSTTTTGSGASASGSAGGGSRR